jgi:DNA-binding transcriptional regulator YhcF (GntR family)
MDYIKSDVYFSIVPEWVIDAPISAQAVRVYAVLCRYADKDDGTCFPSIRTLSERIHVSESTIKRALKELKAIGAIKSQKRFDKATGEQTSNLYTVMRSKELIYDLPNVIDDTSPSSSETHKLESINQSHSLENNLEDRKRLWNALVDAIGYQPSTQVERAGWNKCIKQLREAGAKADDIPNRVSQYKTLFKGMTLTPYALVKHWTLLGESVEKIPKPRDCEEEGHAMIQLDNEFEVCQFCRITSDDLLV